MPIDLTLAHLADHTIPFEVTLWGSKITGEAYVRESPKKEERAKAREELVAKYQAIRAEFTDTLDPEVLTQKSDELQAIAEQIYTLDDEELLSRVRKWDVQMNGKDVPLTPEGLKLLREIDFTTEGKKLFLWIQDAVTSGIQHAVNGGIRFPKFETES